MKGKILQKNICKRKNLFFVLDAMCTKVHRKQKELMMLLVLFVTGLTSLWAQTATQPLGSGTEADPYQIATLENLYWLSQADTAWVRHYKQTADIDATDTKNWNISNGDTLGFSPIGNSTTYFTGNYNGNNHIISNLYINRPLEDNIGLFGVISNDTINNIGLTNVYVSGNRYTGGLFGNGYNSSLIKECYVTGDIFGAGMYTGGICGICYSYIRDCYTTANVTGTYCGGLVGWCGSSNSYGLGAISNCYAIGKVISSGNVGGFTGCNHYNIISDCFYNKETSGQTDDYATGLTTAQMKNATNFAGFDFSNTWEIEEGISFPRLKAVYNMPVVLPDFLIVAKVNEEYTDTLPLVRMDNKIISVSIVDGPQGMELTNDTIITWFPGNNGIHYVTLKITDAGGKISTPTFKAVSITCKGSGTEDAPYEITTIEELNMVHELPSFYYRLMNDLDFSGSPYSRSNSVEGWEPIGNGTITFTGNFNGGGHTISNLYINRPNDDDIGLFGYTYSAAIDSLGLTGVDITGNNDVGGLVGAISNSNVSNSYSTGSVAGNQNVGGLVGNNAFASISNSYSTGSVSGNQNVGGLVGYNQYNGYVSNSYSTGSVTGNSSVGGLVGSNFNSPVSNSYSTGSVVGNTDAGGLAGSNSSSTFTGVYYNSETSGVNIGIGTDYDAQTVTGLTTAQMKNPDSFTPWGLDTSNVWGMRSDSTYPALLNLDNAPFALPDTVSGSLSALLQNDFDYETLQENLVLKIDSAIVLPAGTEYITDLTSLNNGDSIRIVYRAGEIRKQKGDTLHGNATTSYLKINNTAPVVTDTIEVEEDAIFSSSIKSLANDANGDVLFFTLLELTQMGQLSLTGDEFTYTPEADFYGTDSLKIRVSDQLSITEGWVYIKVQNVNDAPELTSVETGLGIDEDNTITLSMGNVTASDVDGDELTLVISDGVNYAVNTLTITPDADFNGMLTVPVAVTDGGETTETMEMTITVNAINDAPVISVVATGLSVDEDNSITLSMGDVTASDVEGGAISLAIGKGDNYSVDGLSVTPEADYNGIITLPVWVSDGELTSETMDMTITVNAINDAPVITSTAGADAEVGNEYTYSVSASDVDNETLSYSLSNQPNGMEVSSGGVITWTPENGTTTSGEVTLTVSDGELSATENFTISVTGSTGINDVGLETITLYPNPASETLYLRGFEGRAKVYLYNSQGQLVLEQEVSEGEAVQIGNLPKGTYLSRIVLEKSVITKSIIKAE